MATAGCYKNVATAICNAVWKLGDVDSHCMGDNSQYEAIYRRTGLVTNVLCMQEEFRERWLSYFR
jgi:hypothetical protein